MTFFTGVVRCGMPIHVLLERVEYSSENNIVMMFSWCPPIQVNQMRSLSRYKVQLHTIDGDLLLNDSIQHESDIVPYLSGTYGGEPGRLFTQSFAAMIFKEETTVDPEGAVTSTVSLNRNNAPVRPKDPPPGQPPNLNPHSPTASFPTTVIAVVLLVGLAVVVVIICTVCILWTRTRRRETNDRLENLHLEQMYQEKAIEKTRDIDPILKNKEISHDQVIIEQKLGEGEFGLVHMGKVTGMKKKVDDVVVAIKTTKVGAFDDVKEDLLNEMKLIAELGDHVNILCLLACCSMNEPFYLITEYMKYGDLLVFLRECRRTENSEKDQIYSVEEKQQFIIARDIANGMTHIQEKRFYHGDLAARNVLVGEGLTIKIADFGLADDIYTRGYKRRATEQKIPVKWCSLETILNGICSSEGDSWSFGVLLYEIFTLGGTPYPGIAPRLLVSQLKNGYRMEQPGSCPDDIYDLMKRCWQEAPHSRPRFEHMFEEIGDMLMKRSDYVEFDGEEFLQNEELLELERRGSTSLNDYHISKLAPILDEDSQVDFDELQVALKNPMTNKEDEPSV
ncbi:putative vascular endothelial growth factor receptor 1-like [Apostichopus japonicus]|uniref:Putative vascular endothelial growth factor receptor 1-like n=1 Tax=Stichopus japonicus TaxID=307972 RepID=A0A2G8K079_STIJA|nr:putative vascular endothelial growth factor receptor 1-like [Apostichopus japonicus]